MAGTSPAMTESESPRHNFAPMCTHVRPIGHAGGAMIARTGYGTALLLILAAGFGVASGLPADAQAVTPENNPDTPAAKDAPPADANDTDISGLELDWSQLNVDASTLTTSKASKGRPAPQTSSDMSWSSKDKPNGSAVSVKQPFSPFLDTKIGAHMT